MNRVAHVLGYPGMGVVVSNLTVSRQVKMIDRNHTDWLMN